MSEPIVPYGNVPQNRYDLDSYLDRINKERQNILDEATQRGLKFLDSTWKIRKFDNTVITAGGQPFIPGEGWKSAKYVSNHLKIQKGIRILLNGYLSLLCVFAFSDFFSWINHDIGDIQHRILIYRFFLYGGVTFLILNYTVLNKFTKQ